MAERQMNYRYGVHIDRIQTTNNAAKIGATTIYILGAKELKVRNLLSQLVSLRNHIALALG
jgi:hypothetical protein